MIFGEFMQKTKRELMDDGLTNEKVVAHEMFHQWFGDLVTTESWANLTLNEGFANYSEYLWLEHKHGRDAADDHLMTRAARLYPSRQQTAVTRLSTMATPAVKTCSTRTPTTKAAAFFTCYANK